MDWLHLIKGVLLSFILMREGNGGVFWGVSRNSTCILWICGLFGERGAALLFERENTYLVLSSVYLRSSVCFASMILLLSNFWLEGPGKTSSWEAWGGVRRWNSGVIFCFVCLPALCSPFLYITFFFFFFFMV